MFTTDLEVWAASITLEFINKKLLSARSFTLKSHILFFMDIAFCTFSVDALKRCKMQYALCILHFAPFQWCTAISMYNTWTTSLSHVSFPYPVECAYENVRRLKLRCTSIFASPVILLQCTPPWFPPAQILIFFWYCQIPRTLPQSALLALISAFSRSSVNPVATTVTMMTISLMFLFSLLLLLPCILLQLLFFLA